MLSSATVTAAASVAACTTTHKKFEFTKPCCSAFNPHLGVRGKYLAIGDRAQSQELSHGAYFVGKLAWAKGLDLLFDHMQFVKQRYCVA